MITVAIPTFNCAQYLPYVLSRLQHQKIPNLPVIIYDQGSVDGTVGYCAEVAGNNFFQKKSQEKNALRIAFFVGQQNPINHPYVNAMECRKKISDLIKTKYVFFLDPDVLIKPLSLPRLVDELEDAAYIGMKYEPDTLDHANHKHIMMGATLWANETFKSLPKFKNEDLKSGCDCNFCFREVEKLGLKAKHSIIKAEHLKNVLV